MSNKISLFHISIPMTEPFRISSGEVTHKDSIIVVIKRDGITAFGEASPMSGGFYSNETPETTWDFLLNQAIPLVIKEKSFRPEYVDILLDCEMHEPFAWAGLEGALWDLRVQEEKTSFIKQLGVSPAPIESGLAVGIYPTIEELIEACKRYLNDGYKRLKIKIEPGWDIEPLQAVREAFPAIPLMFDANAAYGEKDFEIFERIDAMNLMMMEQPLAKKNASGHIQLQKRLSTPICIDESAYSLEAVGEAINQQVCRIVNIKIQRLGGISRAKRIYDLCKKRDMPNWMGTMPELGIGAMHALYMALLPNCLYPTDVESSKRWFVEDIITPEIEVKNGFIEIPQEHIDRPNVNMTVVEKYTLREKSVLL